MSNQHLPPTPPAARSDKDPGDQGSPKQKSDIASPGNRPVPENLAEQDHQANIKQNTTSQGNRRDR